MKKIIAILLCVVILSSSLVLTTSAASTSERDAVLNMACELFPEHAATILGQKIATHDDKSLPQKRVKVFEDTRSYSDDSALTYTEFSDGVAMLTLNEYKKEFVQVDCVETGNYLLRYTFNVKVYSTYDQSKLQINGIQSIVDMQWYDNFVDRGTISSDSVSSARISNDYKEWEDANGSAYSKYTGSFPVSGRPDEDITVTIYAGDNSWYVNVDNA